MNSWTKVNVTVFLEQKIPGKWIHYISKLSNEPFINYILDILSVLCCTSIVQTFAFKVLEWLNNCSPCVAIELKTCPDQCTQLYQYVLLDCKQAAITQVCHFSKRVISTIEMSAGKSVIKLLAILIFAGLLLEILLVTCRSSIKLVLSDRQNYKHVR